MNLAQEFSAQLYSRMFTRKRFVQGNHAVQDESFCGRQLIEFGFQSAFQILQDHRHQADVGDLVPGESVADELGAQGAQMDNARAAHERADEADHEIDSMVRRQNTEIANAGPKGIPGRQSLALFEVVLVRQHTAFRTAAGSGGIDDAGGILTLAGNKHRIAAAAEVLPAKGTGQLGFQRSLRHQDRFKLVIRKGGLLHDGAPEVVLNDEYFGIAVSQQLQVFRRSQLVIKRNDHTTRIKNRVRRHQPLRLIRHDYRGTIKGLEIRVLQGSRQRERHVLEVGVSEAAFFLVAIGLDQTRLVRPALDSVAQSFAETVVLAQIEHERSISPQRQRGVR